MRSSRKELIVLRFPLRKLAARVAGTSKENVTGRKVTVQHGRVREKRALSTVSSVMNFPVIYWLPQKKDPTTLTT